MSRSFKELIILVVMLPFVILPLVLASYGDKEAGAGAKIAPSQVSSNSSHSNLHFVVVTHGQSSDSFWSVVKKGVEQAAKDMGVQVQYQAPDTFDMVEMTHLIDAAVASKPDGLVVSIPDVSALGPSVQRAVAAGIPVISINSGSDAAKKLGVLAHVGQTEYEAGFGGGQKMAAAGVKHALCVNHEVGNASLETRCKGFTDAMKQAGAKVDVLAVNLADPSESQQRIQAALLSNPNIDGLLTLGPNGAAPALKALQNLNKVKQIKLATFDLSPDVLQAIKNANILFAIDQQQYLQGYLPIVQLTLYRTNLNAIANDVLMTGPGFVTQDNAAQVIDLAQQGTR